MNFVVEKNIEKNFDSANSKMRVAIAEEIDRMTADSTTRGKKRSEKGTFRIDITEASGGNMLVQMQSGSATFASATYSFSLVDIIGANFSAFKEALKEVLKISQQTGYNSIITWVGPTSSTPPRPTPPRPAPPRPAPPPKKKIAK